MMTNDKPFVIVRSFLDGSWAHIVPYRAFATVAEAEIEAQGLSDRMGYEYQVRSFLYDDKHRWNELICYTRP